MPDQNSSSTVTSPLARPRSWRRNAAFAIVAVTLFFALAEGVVRLLGFDAWQLDFGVYKNIPGDITPNQRIEYQFQNFDHRYTITINENGWREPSRLRGRPFRVLCVGDSSTLGFGVEDHETYPAQLQQFLDGHYAGLFDVINAGVVGYTIDDELEYLLEKGFALEPSVVVLEVFWNDVLEKDIRKKSSQRDYSKKSWPYLPPASWAMKSALYQTIRNKFLWMEVKRGDFPELPTDKLQVAMEPDAHAAQWAPYDVQFLRLGEECRRRGIPLIVAVTPHQYQVYDWNFPAWDYAGANGFQRHIAALGAQAGAQVADLLPAYRREASAYPALYLSEGLYDEHVGPHGQWLKALTVFAVLDSPMISFHNLYYEAVSESSSMVSGDFKPGRLWRPRDDNGGLFFRRGGFALVELQREGEAARDMIFSAGLAAIGNHESGVSVMLFDAEIAGDATPTSPALRILAEFPPIAFPLDDAIHPARAELTSLRGNAILIVIDEPLAIEGTRGMQARMNAPRAAEKPQSSAPEATAADQSYLYFLRQPLLYSEQMKLPPAEPPANQP